MLTQTRLKELLHYDPDTGLFVWCCPHKKIKIGSRAGTAWKYVQIMIDQKKYYAHRLAWLYVYGPFVGELDHINRNRLDNRISNLRLVTRSQNLQNTKLATRNKSGYRGVHFHKTLGKWRATIQVSGQSIHLGYFEDVEKAAAAYNAAAAIHFTHYLIPASWA